MMEGYSDKIKQCVFGIVGMLIAIVVGMSLSGCSPKVIYVPEKHTEYITQTDTFIKIDSVIVRDSTIIVQKGDTMLVEKWHTQYRDRWREKIVLDTIMRADTISVPYPVEKKVPAEINGWQWFQICAGRIALCLLALISIIIIIRFNIRKHGFS